MKKEKYARERLRDIMWTRLYGFRPEISSPEYQSTVNAVEDVLKEFKLLPNRVRLISEIQRLENLNRSLTKRLDNEQNRQ